MIPIKYVFVREKWQIASTIQGSGNTCNIGSIKNIEHIKKNKYLFDNENEFDNYWLNK